MSREERKARRANKDKKKLGETKVGIFLKEKAPNLIGTGLQIIGDLTGRETLENLGKKILGSKELTEDEQQHALDLIQLDLQEMQEISERWKSDNEQELKLPKIIRPLVLAFTWVLLTILIVLDACGVIIRSNYVDVFEILALTVNGAYFSARTIEKYHAKKHS
jgi:hypothetical protein